MPRPSRLAVPLSSLSGVGPRLAERAARIGVETVGDLLANVPHRHEDRSDQTPDLRPAPRRREDDRGRGPVGEGAADPAPQPEDRRGQGRRRVGRRQGRLVQPGMARRPPRAGEPLAPARKARSKRLSRLRLRGAGGGGHPHHRHRPHPFGDRGPGAEEAPRLDLAGARARHRRGRAAPRGDPRPARARRRRRRDRRRPLPRHARAGRSRRGSGWPSRSSSCIRPRSRSAAAAASSSGPRSRSSRPASSSRAGSTPCRSSRPPTSCRAMDEIDADLASGRPMQRLLMGEVGSGKTVLAAVRDAARGRGRPPGGADGADRDPRRAARGDPRPAARALDAQLHAADRVLARRRPPRGARPARVGGALDRRRHPRADRGGRSSSRASASRSSTSSTASAFASAPRSIARRPATRCHTSCT